MPERYVNSSILSRKKVNERILKILLEEQWGKGWSESKGGIEKTVLDLICLFRRKRSIWMLATSLFCQFYFEFSVFAQDQMSGAALLNCVMHTPALTPCDLATVSVVKGTWEGASHDFYFYQQHQNRSVTIQDKRLKTLMVKDLMRVFLIRKCNYFCSI